jgi:hypothetical protein
VQAVELDLMRLLRRCQDRAKLAAIHEQTEAADRASLGDHLGACPARRCISALVGTLARLR